MLTLAQQKGTETVNVYQLQDAAIIGNEESAGLFIDDPELSAAHAELLLHENTWCIRNLDNDIGTWLNDDRVVTVEELHEGDQITIGDDLKLVVVNASEYQPDSFATQFLSDSALHTQLFAQDVHSTILNATASLTISIGNRLHKQFELTRPVYTIGRASGNDIVIPSAFISRQHAELRKIGERYHLIEYPDVKNKIYINGRSLDGPYALQQTDKIRIGRGNSDQAVQLGYVGSLEWASAIVKESVRLEDGQTLTFGRDKAADVVIDAPNVSRQHATLRRDKDVLVVTDLDSANGTFINGKRISGEVTAQVKDILQIGSHSFTLNLKTIHKAQVLDGFRVEAINLNKQVRPDLNILQNISLTFDPGDFVVVVGQSGGGKSTLVDSIAGYRPATSGEVKVNGIDVYQNFDAVRNFIGYVPQKDIIHTELTVWQALEYAARLRLPRDMTKAERDERIREVLADLKLTERASTQISSLSGGQLKRVSIGVELLTKPSLFFLDEPTSGLDPGTETEFMHLVRNLADQGRTIVLITHATKNVMLADKVVFLARGGYLSWFGPPEEALQYFKQFDPIRASDPTARLEFDDIYNLLDDPQLGGPADWKARFETARAAKQPLLTNAISAQDHQPQAVAKPNVVKSKRPRVSGLHQFQVLTQRNFHILARDRLALVLMLLLPLAVAMTDFVLAWSLGRNVFDYVDGGFSTAAMSLFAPTLYALLVGGLSQMREIVKEGDVYRRERLVNLKIGPYLFSKLAVAAALALYQALIYLTVHYIAFDMPYGLFEHSLMYVSLVLATFGGMMIGLLSSALSTSQATTPLIIIFFMIPQIMLSGALVPIPAVIRDTTFIRWAYEGLVITNGTFSDASSAACRSELIESVSIQNTDDSAIACACLGESVLNVESCNLPGLGSEMDASIIALGKPSAPEDLGDAPEPPTQPEFSEPNAFGAPPATPMPPSQSELLAIQDGTLRDPRDVYIEDLQDWLEDLEAEQDAFVETFEAEIDTFTADLDAFDVERNSFEQELEDNIDDLEIFAEDDALYQGEIVKAESIVNRLHDDSDWLFVVKDSSEYWQRLQWSWLMQLGLIALIIPVIYLLQKRKDIL